MKYILILLITSFFAFGQVPILPIGMGSEKDTTLTSLTIDNSELDFYPLVAECYKVRLEFKDGWEDFFFDYDSICPDIIDVRITVGNKTIDYTMDEFLERLGFKE